MTEYNQERLGLVDFCKFLGEAASTYKIPVSAGYSNLGLFYKTLDIEKTIDFGKVEEERAKLISAFEKALTKKDLETLFVNSMEFKAGRTSAGRYHDYLRGLARSYNVATKPYPNLELYTDYLVIYEKINNYNLFNEITSLEDGIRGKLLINDDQRRLSKFSKNIRLLSKMFDIALSKEDVEYYQKNKADFNSQIFIDFIGSEAKKYKEAFNYDPDFKNIDKYLPDLENFYRIADTRDEAIIENTLQQMDQKGLSVVALITGGYHTEGITERLRSRGVSYMVITPRITKADTNNPYLKILSGERDSFEKMLEGGKGNLAASSFLAARTMGQAVNDAVASYKEAALLSLSGLVYSLRQKNPDITAQQIRDAIQREKEAWLGRFQKQVPDAELQGLFKRSLEAIDISAGDGFLGMDRSGCYYIPVSIEGQRMFIRYYNLASKPNDGDKISPVYQGEAASVGIQILTAEQCRIAVQAAGILTEAPPAPKQAISAEVAEPFRREFEQWAAAKGAGITMQEKIEKLAELFVKSMHGLRGSPDDWLLEMVKALNPGNDALQETAARSYAEFRQRLAEACGPQALNAALRDPDNGNPLFTERYSSPAYVSTDLSAILLTAIDMTVSGGRVFYDNDERLYHTAYSMCQLGHLSGISINHGATGVEFLGRLTAAGQRFIAHVKRTPSDREANHYVEVEAIADKVVYMDNGVEKTVSLEEFSAMWSGVILISERAKAAVKSFSSVYVFEPISDEQLKNIKGACGVIRTVGGGIGFPGQIGSQMLVEYRGRDDFGISYLTWWGLEVLKVKGYSEGFVREVYLNGQGIPETAMYYLPERFVGDDIVLKTAMNKLKTGARLNYDERLALHKKWRSLTGQETEQIRGAMTSAEYAKREKDQIGSLSLPSFSVKDMYAVRLDANGRADKTNSVGVGTAGAPFWSGRWHQITEDMAALFDSIKTTHGVDSNLIKYFVKFELEEAASERFKGELNEEDLKAKIGEYSRDYDRLIDRVLRKEKLEGDQEKWSEIYALIEGRYVKVPAMFTQDPARRMFQLQAGILATFKVREEYKEAIEKIYTRKIAEAYKSKLGPEARPELLGSRNFMEEWLEEARLNMPGRAFEAVTEWFQTRFVDERERSATGMQLGRVDSITLGHMYWLDWVGGHDRWATTGSTEKKNGQPHTDLGTLAGIDRETLTSILQNTPLKSGMTPQERLRAYMETAKHLPEEQKGRPTRVLAHNGDLNAATVNEVRGMLEGRGYNFLTEDNKKIGTDTKALIVFWEYLYDCYLLDSIRPDHKVSKETLCYFKTEDPGNFMNSDYAIMWNQMMEAARQRGKPISPDEVALRVALTVFGKGSEIAIDTYSMHMPHKHFAVSHSRPLYIVIVDDKYQITSDSSSALKALWDPKQVEEDVRKLNEIDVSGMVELDKKEKARDSQLAALRQQRDSHQIEPAAFEQKSNAVLEVFNAEVKGIIAGVDKAKAEIKSRYKAKVIKLDGEQKVVSMTKVFRNGKFEVVPEFSDFMGNSLDPATTEGISIKENSTIPIDLADKGKFRTFAEKHISEIPWVVGLSRNAYIRENSVDMGIKRDAQGLITQHGIEIQKLKEKYGENLENLKRIIITGIGSSERDADAVKRLFKTLLPGVEIITTGPADLVSTNMNLNADHDFVVGLSWSGTTALTLYALEIAGEKGAGLSSLTGNPGKDIGVLTTRSMGTIEVKTGQEVAVFTTKGFEGILYDLSVLGTQLSKKDSLVNRAGEHFKAANSAMVIGSTHNAPIGREGELKVEEVRWVLAKPYDYADDRIWKLLRKDMPADEKKIVIIDATDPDRLDEAFATIKRLNELGIDFIVQTFRDGNKHFDDINAICGRNGCFLNVVPRVDPALQGLVNIIFYQKFAIALARAAGLSDTEIDSCRNLAKSVTVKGAQKPGVLFEMFAYAGQLKRNFVAARNEYAEYAGKAWSELNTAREKAITRLPLRYFDLLNKYSGAQAGLTQTKDFSLDREAVRKFGADKVKKIVVLVDEESPAIAANMAKNPLEYQERVATGKSLFKPEKDERGEKETKTVKNVPINGQYYNVTYNFRLDEFVIERVVEREQDRQPPITIRGDGSVSGVNRAQFEFNGFPAGVAKFFNGEFNITANKTEGLIFEAKKPKLLGAKVVVHRLTDYDLAQDVDENTIVVAISRSNNRAENNARIQDIADPVKGRSEEQMAFPADAKSEIGMTAKLAEFKNRGVPIFTIADRDSAVRQFGQESLGETVLSRDIDDTSFTGLSYLALMGLGTSLGELKGIYTADYRVGLESSVDLAASVVRNSTQNQELLNALVRLRQNEFNRQYNTVQIIGGAQDFSSALAYEYMLERLGFQAEALPVDESVHGPLAAVNDDANKFESSDEKVGVNPKFDPNPQKLSKLKDKDCLVVVLATDSRTMSASIIDTQRNMTRSSRLILVVKESDRNRAEVVNSGAYLILTIPDSPNELTSISHTALANIFADAMAKSKDPKYNYENIQEKPGLATLISTTVEELLAPAEPTPKPFGLSIKTVTAERFAESAV
ncbi:MAG: hypothetical protein NTV07_01775 [Candidatus Omnitrophica bacterium]|nr:hypothetical protein [Candidatus Omnitrophota bacterium]